MGRKSRFSTKIVKSISKFVEEGNTKKDAAILAGISPSTFFNWQNGEGITNKQKLDFLDSIKKAELKCKARNINIIQKAANKHWTAAAWWLERKYKEEFAAKTKQEITGEHGKPFIVKLVGNCLTPPGGYVSSSKESSVQTERV